MSLFHRHMLVTLFVAWSSTGCVSSCDSDVLPGLEVQADQGELTDVEVPLDLDSTDDLLDVASDMSEDRAEEDMVLEGDMPRDVAPDMSRDMVQDVAPDMAGEDMSVMMPPPQDPLCVGLPQRQVRYLDSAVGGWRYGLREGMGQEVEIPGQAPGALALAFGDPSRQVVGFLLSRPRLASDSNNLATLHRGVLSDLFSHVTSNQSSITTELSTHDGFDASSGDAFGEHPTEITLHGLRNEVLETLMSMDASARALLPSPSEASHQQFTFTVGIVLRPDRLFTLVMLAPSQELHSNPQTLAALREQSIDSLARVFTPTQRRCYTLYFDRPAQEDVLLVVSQNMSSYARITQTITQAWTRWNQTQGLDVRMLVTSMDPSNRGRTPVWRDKAVDVDRDLRLHVENRTSSGSHGLQNAAHWVDVLDDPSRGPSWRPGSVRHVVLISEETDPGLGGVAPDGQTFDVNALTSSLRDSARVHALIPECRDQDASCLALWDRSAGRFRLQTSWEQFLQNRDSWETVVDRPGDVDIVGVVPDTSIYPSTRLWRIDDPIGAIYADIPSVGSDGFIRWSSSNDFTILLQGDARPVRGDANYYLMVYETYLNPTTP